MSDKNLSDLDTDLLKEIYEKISFVESKVLKTEKLLTEGENILSTSVDSVDSILGKFNTNNKIEKILFILDKISSDNSIDRLSKLVDKLDKLIPIIENANIISFLADILDDLSTSLKDSGIELSTLISNIIKIIPLLDKNFFDIIYKVLDNTSLLIKALDSLESVPGLIDTLADTFDEYAGLLNKNILEKTSDFNQVKEDFSLSISKVNKSSNEIGILDLLRLLNDNQIRKQAFVVLSTLKSVSSRVLK